MNSRRQFIKRSLQYSAVAATSSLWKSAGLQAFAQTSSSNYKAVVVVELIGGSDANNMLVPLDPALYAEYSAIRGSVALPSGSCLPLQHGSGEAFYGLHASLPSIAKLYNDKKALFVANVGPLRTLATKQQMIATPSLNPNLFSHQFGVAQWESAQTTDSATLGWGGRIGDLIAFQSGTLPPLLNCGVQTLFTVGETVQAVAIQPGGSAVLSPELDQLIMQIAQADTNSANALVAQAAKLKVASQQQQTLIDQASAYSQLKTQFPATQTGSLFQRVAQIIAGRSVVDASRQIFLVPQGVYDSHMSQLTQQSYWFSDLDNGLSAFMAALDEMGMTDDVLVCTVSDFNRSMTPNVNAGTDHGWGSHQIVLGGGIKGGRIMGTFPTLEIGGPDDLNGLGCWIPTTGVPQFTAGIGKWMGLSASQINSVFPELSKFPAGSLNFAA